MQPWQVFSAGQDRRWCLAALKAFGSDAVQIAGKASIVCMADDIVLRAIYA